MSKRVESEARLPRRSSASVTPELDVVNLSCQLVSMELHPEENQKKEAPSKELTSCSSQQLGSSGVPAKGRKRKMVQKVRFDVPEDIGENKTKSAPKRRRSPSPRCERKKIIPVCSNTYTQMMWKAKSCVDALVEHAHNVASTAPLQVNGAQTLVPCQNSAGTESDMEQSEKKPRISGKAATDVVRVVLDKNNNVHENLNDNCSSSYKLKLEPNGKNVPLKKSKSDPVAYRKKLNKYLKKAKVVSKKHGLKKTKISAGIKRKHRDLDCHGDGHGKKSVIKKRKQSSSNKPTPTKTPKKAKSGKSKSPSRLKLQKGSRSPSYKTKKLSAKMKKAADKIKKAKEMKLKKRIKQLQKRSANKKAALKKKVYMNTKHCEKLGSKQSKKKSVGRTRARDRRLICSCHGNRKLKIKPIARADGYEVIPPLRVSFLKYVTFQEACDQNFDCCRRFCCDKWPEMDMDTIIDDYD